MRPAQAQSTSMHVSLATLAQSLLVALWRTSRQRRRSGQTQYISPASEQAN
jgi:hypothetical protein